MQDDKRADKKDRLSRNHQGAQGFSVRGKSFLSSKPSLNGGREHHKGSHKGGSKNGATATCDTEAQVVTRIPRKQKDTRSEKMTKLKSRILVRKYAQLWLHFTYGKVSPCLARKLKELHLKKKVFAAWKEEWWIARKEWKLEIRAECHNRYRLWLKVWTAWRQYVKLEQNDKCLQAKAISYHNKRTLRVIINGWKEYADLKRAEKLLHAHVASSSSTLLKRRCFNLWLKRLDANHQIVQLESTALHHWAYNQLLKAWLQWRNQLQQKISLHQHMHVLIQNHQIRSLRNCWVGWTCYVKHRKTKIRNKGVAEEQFNLSLMAKYFDQWLNRHKRVQEIAQFHEQLAHKERLARFRRVFNHWKHYVIIKHYYRRLNEVSNEHYARSLKSLAFKGLQLFLNLKQQKEAHNVLATKHRRSMLLSSCWHCWIRKCEHSEEIKMLPQSRLAFNHFWKVTLIQFMTKWKQYVIWRRHRKEQYSIADKYFNDKIIPKVFDAFRGYVDICKYKLQIVSAANNFRRENLLSMVFYQWWRSSVQHQDLRMMERMAILHSEETIKKSTFTIWRLKTKMTLVNNDLQRRADDHNYYRVILKMLCQWKLFCRLSVQKQEIKIKATICYRLKLLRLTWNGWKKYIHQRRRKHQQWQKACDHHSLILKKKTFNVYKYYHKRQLIKKDMNIRVLSFYNHHVLRSLCRSWKVFVLQQREFRSMKLQSSLHYNGKLIRKVWNNWRHNTECQVSLREVQEQKVIHFQKQLQHSQMMSVFVTWKYHRDQRIVNRLKWERSVCLHRETLLYKCFIAWIQYYHLKLRKLLLNQKSSWFHENRLKAACYSQWRLQLMRKLIRNQKRSLALWKWSQTLQQKVMHSWLEYTKYRKRRLKLYDEAMAYYRKTLLDTGITEWIKVATWQATQRQERALEKQTKNVQSTIMCVRRCAQHWRKWAHKKSLQSPNPQQNVLPSQRAINGMNTEWINVVKKFNIPISTATTAAQKKRPQPRKPNFLASNNFIDNQSSGVLQGIAVEQSSLNAAESIESVPRKQVFPLSPSIIQHEEFTFLPSSPSEASLIAVNSSEDQPLLDVCMKKRDLSKLSLKQPAIVPLPPSAFESKHPDSSKHSHEKSVQADLQLKQHKISQDKFSLADKQMKQQKEFPSEVSCSELTGMDVKLKNLTVNQEILYIKKFLKKYYSIKEKLRIIEDKIKNLKAAENSPHDTLKQLQEEQAMISSALEFHKPTMLRMVARSNELQMYYQ